MYWINFLHFYQPANIDSFSIKEALDKSYFRILRLLEENHHLHMTWNISACLLQRLQDEGEEGFIKRLKKLYQKKQIELTSSAAYHGLLPLLPTKEIELQIKENEKILQKILGIKKRLPGFFLPEMAYTTKVSRILKNLGYKWIILDELAVFKYPALEKNSYFIDKSSGLKVVFRNRYVSTSYPPAKILEFLKNNETKKTLITATDAELYGLRHEDPTGEMEQVARKKSIKTETISHFISRLEVANFIPKKLSLVACSWDSTVADLKKGQPFKLWQDDNNLIHQELWKLTKLALSMGEKFKQDKNYKWYRWHLVRGIASCTFWWASTYDFSNVFGPYAWNPDIIERGLEDLIRSIRSLASYKSKKYKLQAEKYYLKIKQLIWQEHWHKHWPN